MFDIKINAIYFPQYHEIPENNEFWGKGFTEWTLLEPFNNSFMACEKTIQIMKPHNDIGYYDLSDSNILMKQIEIAKKYNINGFIIYHYWFSIDKRPLHKILEYFLDEKINFKFCISWANESWTKRWDGLNNDILIKQEYNDHLEHIKYLIPFFKNKNYIKNTNKECIFYIYNISDIPDLDNMIAIWKNELMKHNINIKFVVTENSFKNTHNFKGYDSYIFEPMYSGHYIKHNIKNNICRSTYSTGSAISHINASVPTFQDDIFTILGTTDTNNSQYRQMDTTLRDSAASISALTASGLTATDITNIGIFAAWLRANSSAINGNFNSGNTISVGDSKTTTPLSGILA
jgi:hypothetical protein